MSTHFDLSSSSFEQLGLSPALVRAVTEAGYEHPTPIQAQAIPVLLQGSDIIGKAQTGTGKTAAFSLPILETVDPRTQAVQAIVLTPTRELAIQVTESLETYARYMGVRTLAVYGGQHIGIQLRELSRGVHVVVGTPGRVMDHLRRGTLQLESVQTFVLDEADEMLRMGFVDDVEWIMAHAPEGRRMALFSATMPPEVARIAHQHLREPVTIAIESPREAAIEQRFIKLAPRQKFLALHRILLAEPIEGVLIFARTRQETADLTTLLIEHGHRAEALHGDMNQSQRENVMSRFKDGQIDIVVGTDVAARGLDVEHITHVINYDVPNDIDVYTHRIGRTGRAGRKGVAILFVQGREMRILNHIERRTGRSIAPMTIPSPEEVARRRAEGLKARIREMLATPANLDVNYAVVKELAAEGFHMTEIAAAASFLAAGPLRDASVNVNLPPERGGRFDDGDRPARKPNGSYARGDKAGKGGKRNGKPRSSDGRPDFEGRPRKKSAPGARPERPKKRTKN